MKTTLLLILILLSMPALSQSWNQIIDYSGSARDDGTSFTIGDKVYCGTGRNAGFNMTSDFKAFDLVTESWSPISSLPDSVKRQYAASFTHNGEGYIFGGVGDNSNFFNDVWKYNPTSDEWSHVSDQPGIGRSGASCVVLGDKVYILGGNNFQQPTETENWELDLINLTWTHMSDLPDLGMWRGVAFGYDTTIFYGLGINSLDETNSDFYHYLPSTDQWQLVPQLVLNPRSYVVHTQIGDSVYLYGGVDTLGNYVNSFERINLPSLTIDVLTPFPSTARKGTMAFASHNDFYITTGITTTSRLSQTWVAVNVVGLDILSAAEIKVYKSGEEIIFQTDRILKSMEIISMDGRVIKSKNKNEIERVQINDVDSGVYLWHIEVAGGGRYSGRIYID